MRCFKMKFTLIEFLMSKICKRSVPLRHCRFAPCEAGGQFFETVVRPEGLMWVGIGFLITVVPVVIVGLIILKTKKYDFGSICGILCGSMANPMALTYANETLDGDTPSISYATVYPLGMFIRVVIAQVIVMFFV